MLLDPSLPNAIAAYNFTRTEFKANGTDILDSYGHRGFDGVLLSSDLPQFVWSTDDYVTLTQIPPPPPSPPPFYYEKERGPSSLYFDGVDVSALIREQDNDPLEFNFSSTDTFFADEPSGYMTFEAWIRPESVREYQFIASVGVSESDDVTNWGIAIMCGRGQGPGCCAEHSGGSLGFVATNGPTELLACSLAPHSSDVKLLKAGEWQHIVSTFPLPPLPLLSFPTRPAFSSNALAGAVWSWLSLFELPSPEPTLIYPSLDLSLHTYPRPSSAGCCGGCTRYSDEHSA